MEIDDLAAVFHLGEELFTGRRSHLWLAKTLSLRRRKGKE
jgi:hypothetical protein